MAEPTKTDIDRADSLAGIVEKRLGIKKANIVCPYEKSSMTPCIVRDGSLCLILVRDAGAICVGCEQSLNRVESQVRGQRIGEGN